MPHGEIEAENFSHDEGKTQNMLAGLLQHEDLAPAGFVDGRQQDDQAVAERMNSNWPTATLATIHLPSASLKVNSAVPSSMKTMPRQWPESIATPVLTARSDMPSRSAFQSGRGPVHAG